MRKLDGRKVGRAALAEMRTRAVQRVLDGESPEVVVRALGFHRAVIYDWIALITQSRGEKEIPLG